MPPGFGEGYSRTRGGFECERYKGTVGRWLPVRCGALHREWGTEGCILVSLPQLSKAYRRTGCRFCGLRTQGLPGNQRRDNQIRFHARTNAAWLLRQVRIDLDMRIAARNHANAFPCRSI